MSTSTLIETPAAQDERATLLVGFELGKSSWLIGLYAPERGNTVSRHKIDGGFALEHVVLVDDRGMITQARIDDELKPAGLDWITSLRAPSIKALTEGGALQLDCSTSATW